MDATAGSLITAFDYVWARLAGRLSGLTDEEYFWEPVAGCWSLRQGGDGRWQLDGGGAAARHLTRSRSPPSPGGSATWAESPSAALPAGGSGTGTLTTGQTGFASRAAAVPAFLDEHYRNWRAGLAGLSPGQWAAPLGPSWGPYAEANTVDLALHVLDEVIHHAAEVGLLRDLYSRRSSLRS